MAPIYPEGGKITAEHADFWVCHWALGRLRRKLRFDSPDILMAICCKGDILNDVSRDTRHDNADAVGVSDVHIADEYVRERAVLGA